MLLLTSISFVSFQVDKLPRKIKELENTGKSTGMALISKFYAKS